MIAPRPLPRSRVPGAGGSAGSSRLTGPGNRPGYEMQRVCRGRPPVVGDGKFYSSLLPARLGYANSLIRRRWREYCSRVWRSFHGPQGGKPYVKSFEEALVLRQPGICQESRSLDISQEHAPRVWTGVGLAGLGRLGACRH